MCVCVCVNNEFKAIFFNWCKVSVIRVHTLQPAIWTTDAIGNSDHIYVTQNDRWEFLWRFSPILPTFWILNLCLICCTTNEKFAYQI